MNAWHVCGKLSVEEKRWDGNEGGKEGVSGPIESPTFSFNLIQFNLNAHTHSPSPTLRREAEE